MTGVSLDVALALVQAAALGVPMAIAVVNGGDALVTFARADATPFPLTEAAIGEGLPPPRRSPRPVGRGRRGDRRARRVHYLDQRGHRRPGGCSASADCRSSGPAGDQDLAVVEAAVATAVGTP
ncbi:hypothetical protein AB0F15_34170 [Amycolatopsis sp. NPDC026612]|uniref:hypothetical protein n=1 Tax=Amycolatopsis sp. NPDC026612 TaxID=3155466 RepID=UPI0033C15A8B